MQLLYFGPAPQLCLRVLISAGCCLLFGCSSAPQRGSYSSARASAYAATAVNGQAPVVKLPAARGAANSAVKLAQSAPVAPQSPVIAQNQRSIPAPAITLQVRTSMRGPAMQQAAQAAGISPVPAPMPSPAPVTPVALQAPTLQPATFRPAPVPAVLHRPDPVPSAMPDDLDDPVADMPLQAVRSVGGSCPVAVYRIAWSSAARSGLDPAMVAAVIEAESRCRADAVSDAGARGLMQLMPQYGARVGNRLVHGRDVAPNSESLRDPETNIRLGVAYLAALREHFAYIESESARMLLAIAAYNCGADFLERRLPDEARGWDTRHMGRWLQSHAPAETRSYVGAVLANSERYGAAIVAAASRPTAH